MAIMEMMARNTHILVETRVLVIKVQIMAPPTLQGTLLVLASIWRRKRSSSRTPSPVKYGNQCQVWRHRKSLHVCCFLSNAAIAVKLLMPNMLHVSKCRLSSVPC